MGQMTFLSPNWAKALKKTQSTNVIHHWTLTSSTTGHWHHPPLNTDAIYHWVIYHWTLTSSTTEHLCHLPLDTDAIYHWTLTSSTTEHWCYLPLGHLPLDTDVIHHWTLTSSTTEHWCHLSRDTDVIYHGTLTSSTTGHWCHLPLGHLPLDTDIIHHWTLTSSTTGHWCHLPLNCWGKQCYFLNAGRPMPFIKIINKNIKDGNACILFSITQHSFCSAFKMQQRQYFTIQWSWCQL